MWGIALFGVILKIFFTGRFEIFSTLLYLVMGWLVVLDFSYLFNNMERNGLILLIGGGITYTIGILFYAFEKILGKPLAQKTQEGFFRIGLFLLISLMFFTTFQDLRDLGLF